MKGKAILGKQPEEWFRQADYDMDTAELMLNGKKCFYTVFMCHLALEKALKGLYSQRLRDLPPKTHNLIYLVEKTKLELPDNLYDFVFTINRVSVPTRYPDNLERMLQDYDMERTGEIFQKSKVILKWLKAQL